MELLFSAFNGSLLFLYSCLANRSDSYCASTLSAPNLPASVQSFFFLHNENEKPPMIK